MVSRFFPPYRGTAPVLRRLRRDNRGGIAILFALMFVALAMFVGAAVDIGRWLQARQQTVAAMDAAVLAGARVLQLDNTDVAGALEAARKYYTENTKGRIDLVDDTPSFTPINNNKAFAGTSTAHLKTAFLSFARLPELPLKVYAEAALPNKPLEISMMLDITGSMSGSKIRDLRLAAEDLVNIVIPDNTPDNRVRVALVPFSDAVRLPATSISLAVGSPHKIVKKTSGSGSNQKSYLYNRSELCVVERAGDNRYSDVGPSSDNYVLPFRDEATAIPTSQGTVLIDGKSTTAQGARATIDWKSSTNPSRTQKANLEEAANRFASCPVPASGELVPLTDNKPTLISRIKNLPANGMTAGQIGTAWAWYTLSPNWNPLWDTSSAAKPYGHETQKIAILMTDGEYNTQYDANGIATGSSGAGSAVNGTSTNQARALCTEMKKKDILIYTVGFDLGRNSTAATTLNHCATNASMAYTADNGNELRQAFRDIALKINQLYLTH